MKSKLSVLIATVVIIAGTVSCDSKPTSSLGLSHTDTAFVVPGETSNCTDVRSGTSPVPQSVSSDFYKLNNFVLQWQGTNQLVPALILITVEHPYIQGSFSKCEISGTLLEDTFGPPPFLPGNIDMNNPSLGGACSIACGGLKRAAGAEDTSFTATGIIEFIGYSQDSDGSNVRPVRQSSRVRLNFF